MSFEKVLQTLVEEKLQRQRARIGQRDDEAGEAAAGEAHGHDTEVRPIGLALLAWKCAQLQKGFAPPEGMRATSRRI
jgi:hypothetical protein